MLTASHYHPAKAFSVPAQPPTLPKTLWEKSFSSFNDIYSTQKLCLIFFFAQGSALYWGTLLGKTNMVKMSDTVSALQ